MNFFRVLKAEAKLIFSDVAIVLTIIGGVILYAFLYPQPYAEQSVSALSVSMVDLDKSDISREIAFKINATPQVNITRYDLSEKAAKEALIAGEVKAIIVIPNNFKRDVALNVSPTVAVGADSSYFLIYGSVLEGVMRSVLTQSATLKISKLLIKGTPLSGAKESYTSYSLNTINLFNKDNSYTQYVIPAVFILILQQTILIGLGILGGGVNERLARNKQNEYEDRDTFLVMSARFIIFASIFLLHMFFYFGFVFSLFHITHIAKISDLLNFGFAFISASIFLGIFLGSLFNSREIATPTVLFSSLPLVFSIGFIWPLEAIPEVVHYLSLLFPVTPAIQGFLGLNQMGASFEQVLPHYGLLWAQVVIYAFLGYYFINKKRKQYANN